MLHFTRGIALGVNVRHFLQFECAFKRDGIRASTPQVQRIGFLIVTTRHLLNGCVALQRALDQPRQALSVSRC